MEPKFWLSILSIINALFGGNPIVVIPVVLPIVLYLWFDYTPPWACNGFIIICLFRVQDLLPESTAIGESFIFPLLDNQFLVRITPMIMRVMVILIWIANLSVFFL